MPRLADAAHDDATVAGQNERHCGEKSIVQARDKRAYGLGLDRQNAARELQRRSRGVLRYHAGKYSPTPMRNTPAHEALGLRFDRLSPAAYAALAISLCALWLLGHRYGGFIHDASIYALQGLRMLEPASFAGDLFFVHGAQDA